MITRYENIEMNAAFDYNNILHTKGITMPMFLTIYQLRTQTQDITSIFKVATY